MAVVSSFMTVASIPIVFVPLTKVARGVLDTRTVYVHCKKTRADLTITYYYQVAVLRVISKSIQETHSSSYNKHTTANSNGYWRYGRGWCNHQLPSQDCINCLQTANKTGQPLSIPMRAMMSLMECGLRIDYQPFNDKLDTKTDKADRYSFRGERVSNHSGGGGSYLHVHCSTGFSQY